MQDDLRCVKKSKKLEKWWRKLAGEQSNTFRVHPKMEENPLKYVSLASKNGRKSPQHPPKSSPNPSPDGSQITPEALLEPILGQCLKEAQFWMAKKRPSDGQKHPKEAQDHPKPLPKGAQDPPKIDSCWIFGRFFSSFKFALIFQLFYHCFFMARTLKNRGFPLVKPHFLQNRNFPK